MSAKAILLTPFEPNINKWTRQDGIRVIEMATKVDIWLTQLYFQLYGEGKKRLNKDFLKWLAKQVLQTICWSLAWWHMDDGTYHKASGQVRMGTHSFTYEENCWLKGWFKKTLNLNCTVSRSKKHKKHRLKVTNK